MIDQDRDRRIDEQIRKLEQQAKVVASLVREALRSKHKRAVLNSMSVLYVLDTMQERVTTGRF